MKENYINVWLNEPELDFDPLTFFLVDFWNRHTECHGLIRVDDIMGYFKRNPLTDNARAKIETFLREHLDYDVLSARYGFGNTDKLTVWDYAEKIGGSIEEVRQRFKKAMNPRWSITSTLWAMMLGPESLRRAILEIQIQLSYITMAYDMLFEDEKTSSEDEMYFSEEVIKPFNYPSAILIEEDLNIAKLSFNEAMFRVDDHAVQTLLNGLIHERACSGYDIASLGGGEIQIFFNHTHSANERRKTISKVVSLLEEYLINPFDDDDNEVEEYLAGGFNEEIPE